MDGRLYLLIVTCIQFIDLSSGTSKTCPFSTGTIDLSNQGLTTLDSTTFTSVYDCADLFGNTTALILTNNQIASISTTAFSNFYELIRLDLSYNMITAIHKDTFIPLVDLQELRLGHNLLTRLDAGIIDLINLVSVEFENNQITFVEPGIVNDIHDNLIYFNLNYNNLTNLDPWPFMIKDRVGFKRVIFDIQHNQIGAFTNTINWQYDLVYRYEVDVNLQFNVLSFISRDVLDNYNMNFGDTSLSFSAFLTLGSNITNNPFFCDCLLYEFASTLRDSILRWSRIEEFRYRCYAPSAAAGIDWLHDLPLDQLVCNISSVNGCPPSCFCQDRPHNDTFYVDCRNSNLTSLPDLSSLSLNGRSKLEINVDNNSISSLGIMSHIDKLYNLSISSNRLTEVASDFVNNATILDSMDLRNNKITTLAREIQRLNYPSVNLAGNSLWCDCNTMWIREWLQTEPDQGDTNLQCNSDTGMHAVENISKDVLECTNQTIVLVVVLVVVTFFVFLVILLFALRCPYDTKIILHALTRRKFHPWDKYTVDKDEDKVNDIYLIFDERDPDVVGYVSSKLEKGLKRHKPFYNILNPQRVHFQGSASEAMTEAISKAKRVIVILSSNIFTNDARLEEIKHADRNIYEAMAHQRACQEDDKDDDLIMNSAPIIYIKFNKSEKLEIRLKTEPWKSGLTNTKHRKIIDIAYRLFWHRLRYELPSKGSGTPDEPYEDRPLFQTDQNPGRRNDDRFLSIHGRSGRANSFMKNIRSSNHSDLQVFGLPSQTRDHFARHSTNTEHSRRLATPSSSIGDLEEIRVENLPNRTVLPFLKGHAVADLKNAIGKPVKGKDNSRIHFYGRHLTSKDLKSDLHNQSSNA